MPGIHSRYADGTSVLQGQEPARITGPDPSAAGTTHSVVGWDHVNQRVYQLREYNENGEPVCDVDFTNPTFPSGKPRSGHPGPPHKHRWLPVDPQNPAAGFRRGIAEALP